MGLRFSVIRITRRALHPISRDAGDKFMGVEIDSSPGNPWGYKKSAHSVLTEDYSDEATSPTRLALEGVMDFFTSRLGIAPKDTSRKTKPVDAVASIWE